MADPTLYASPLQRVGVAVETVQGTAVVPAVTIPVDAFTPEDKNVFLDDKALRGSMTEPFIRVAGVKASDLDISGPAYFDTLPYFLSNVFGDIVSSGTYTGSGTTTLNSSSAVGATSISTVASIAGSTLIQIDTGTSSEVRLTTGVSGAGPYTVTFATALNVAHAGGATVKPITSPYSHAFAVKNTGTAQPASMTITDYQGPTASTGTRAYAGVCFSEVGLKGTAESGLVEFSGKAMGWPSASAAAFTTAPSAISPQPAWEATIGLNGTVGSAQIKTVNDWELSIKRELEAIYTAQNVQTPYFIQRGKLTVSGRMTIVVADETYLTYLNSNTQPQLQIIISNGLSGANLLAVQIDVQKAAFTTSKLDRGKAAVEAQVDFDAIANTTNAGWTAGYSPALVTVQNAVTPGGYGPPTT